MFRPGLPLFLSSLALVGATWTWRAGAEEREAADLRLAAVERLAAEQSTQARVEEHRLADQMTRLEQDLGSTVRSEFEGRIGLTEASMQELRAQLDQRQALRAEDNLSERLESLGARFEQRLEQLDLTAQEARQLADSGQNALERLGGDLELLRSSKLDPDLLWRELMGPVVQLTGGASVGSGVLLQPVPHPDGNGVRTLVLTAWHVVRDTVPGGLQARVPVTVYAEDGGVLRREASILCHNADLDVALLEITHRGELPHGAVLADADRVAGARVFEPVWAIGCPLGTDPIPTSGEIASPHHSVDGDRYWMINAATYIGNSGGGIFDGSNFELLGVFSKIYNHGAQRPTIVPHMGLVTPLDEVYPWLAEQGWMRDDRGRLVEQALQVAALDEQ